MLTLYMDESYNHRTMCVGGWLAADNRWRIIENQWQKRIEHERRISLKKDQHPISRYHAADCSSRINEFEGWSTDRQILLSKKLFSIIGRNKPYGIAIGADILDFLKVFPNNRKDKEWQTYRFCMLECMRIVANFLSEKFPGVTAAILYDRGPFSSAALSALTIFKSAPGFRNSACIKTAALVGWEDCIALQTADLIAYEGYKLADKRPASQYGFRRSLNALIGKKAAIHARIIELEGFRKFFACEEFAGNMKNGMLPHK